MLRTLFGRPLYLSWRTPTVGANWYSSKTARRFPPESIRGDSFPPRSGVFLSMSFSVLDSNCTPSVRLMRTEECTVQNGFQTLH